MSWKLILELHGAAASGRRDVVAREVFEVGGWTPERFIEEIVRNEDAEEDDLEAARAVGECLLLGRDGKLAVETNLASGVAELLNSRSLSLRRLGSKVLVAQVRSHGVDGLDRAWEVLVRALGSESGWWASTAAESLSRCGRSGAAGAISRAFGVVDVEDSEVMSSITMVRRGDVACRIASESGELLSSMSDGLKPILELVRDGGREDMLMLLTVLDLVPALASHEEGLSLLGVEEEDGVVEDGVVGSLVRLCRGLEEDEMVGQAAVTALGRCMGLCAARGGIGAGRGVELWRRGLEVMLEVVDKVEGRVDVGLVLVDAIAGALQYSPCMVRAVATSAVFEPLRRLWSSLLSKSDTEVSSAAQESLSTVLAASLPSHTATSENESPTPSHLRPLVTSLGADPDNSSNAVQSLFQTLQRNTNVLRSTLHATRAPSPESRIHAYRLCAALAAQPSGWGLHAMAAQDGLVAALLDRSARELSAESQDAKFQVVLAALACPKVDTPEGWGPAIAATLEAIKKQGPYVDADVTMATE